MNEYRLINEFKQCLKPIQIEELTDLVVFRPIAYLIVQAVRPFPISPNQISLLGMLAAVVGAVFFALGSRTDFVFAGLSVLAVSSLDCADGMLARLKNNGSKVGRIIDGLFDYTTTTLLLVGFWLGLRQMHMPLPLAPWLMVMLMGLSLALQSMVVDYYKNQFLAHALGQGRSIDDEISSYEEELQRFQAEGGHPLERLLIRLYLFYSRIQAKSQRRSIQRYHRGEYFRRMVGLVRLWTVIGPGSYRLVLMLAGLLVHPGLFLGYALLFANLWMIIMLIVQTLVKRTVPTVRPRLAREARGSATR